MAKNTLFSAEYSVYDRIVHGPTLDTYFKEFLPHKCKVVRLTGRVFLKKEAGSMNTKNSLEESILDDFRQLPEELRGKFLLMIKNLKAEASARAHTDRKLAWSRQTVEFFETLQKRHFKVDADIDLDSLMQDMNNGLP